MKLSLNKIRATSTCTFGILFLSLSACGGGSNSAPVPEQGRTYLFEQSPTQWETVTVYSTNFTGTRVNGGTTYTFSGTVSPESFDMLTMTVTDSTDPNEIGSLPVVNTAREVDGAMLAMIDKASYQGTAYKNAKIGIPTAGDCTSVAAGNAFHGMILPDPAFDRTSSPFWATVAVSAGTNGLDINVQPYGLSESLQSLPTIGATTVPDFSCAGNTLTTAAGDRITVTPSGMLWMRLAGGESALLTSEAVGLTEADITALGRTSSGVFAVPNDNGDGFGNGNDYMAANALVTNGNNHVISGSKNNLSAVVVTDPAGSDLNWATESLFTPAQSAGAATVPAGMYDASSAITTGNTGARLFSHVMPNGKHFLFGAFEYPTAVTASDWGVILAAEFQAPPSVPAELTTGNKYTLYPSNGGLETQMSVVIDTTAGKMMAIGDTGQIRWGDATALTNGFTRLVITGNSDPYDHAKSQSMVAMEIDDAMLVMSSDTDKITNEGYLNSMIGWNMAGTCTTAGNTFNIIQFPDPNTFNAPTGSSFGTISAINGPVALNMGVSMWNVNQTMADPAGTMSIADFVCTNNILSNGALFISHTASGMNFIIPAPDTILPMLPQVVVNASTLANVNRSYRGIVVRPYDTTGLGDWSMIMDYLDVTTNGTSLIGTPYNDVATNTLKVGESATIGLAPATASVGLFDSADITFGAAQPLKLMAYPNNTTGKYMLVAFAAADTNNDGDTVDPQDYITMILYER